MRQMPISLVYVPSIWTTWRCFATKSAGGGLSVTSRMCRCDSKTTRMPKSYRIRLSSNCRPHVARRGEIPNLTNSRRKLSNSHNLPVQIYLATLSELVMQDSLLFVAQRRKLRPVICSFIRPWGVCKCFTEPLNHYRQSGPINLLINTYYCVILN